MLRMHLGALTAAAHVYRLHLLKKALAQATRLSCQHTKLLCMGNECC
jgi:hypothetical protein